MTSLLPPDPYLALGVSKDAPAATIKATYRKLVLTCHPDKVKDESLKKQKQEEFHKIQQAYELVGDEDKRAKYDAEVKLEQLRKEKLSRTSGAPHVEVKTARYDVRTAAPGGATFSANGPHRYEKTPARSYDDYFDSRPSQKYETYEAYPKHSSSSRTSRPKEEPAKATKISSDRTRSDRAKARDRTEQRERSHKFVYIDDDSSSNDEKARYEAEYRRRSDEDRRRREEEDARKIAAEARRKAEDRRSYEEPKEPRRHRSDDREFDRQRKLSDQENDAVRYIHRSKVEVDARPSPARNSSSRDVRPESYDSRSSRRPEPVRRSSAARPKEPQPSSGRTSLRDRKGIPEIVEWEDDRKAPPSFTKSTSSPADLHVPRTTPQRSYTESSRDHHRRTDTSPPTPVFRRSETMPTHPSSSSSRRKDTTVPRLSGLRTSESASPNEPESFPAVPPPRTTSSNTKYYYPTPGGGVSLRQEDVGVANGHRTILREPDRHRARSPSPLSRPPIGVNRPVVDTSSPTARVASSTIPPPPLGRSATFNASSPVRAGEERGRSQRLYREVPSDYSRRENGRRQTSFSPDTVSYARKIGPEDISWSAPRGRDHDRDREYARPTFGRSETYVY